ncbi:hypothetical protein ANO14919_004510 [Xylariales sp. No.14919]|nr:hypothetical protein F5X98DRAFT_159264 [Xylaria grammica]GAW11111.1 hypothetical protein ANO14919_004510 [Xylariales sp. No.14919]
MNTTSPNKRRALAPVDANTRSPLGPSRLSPFKLDLPRSKMALGTSPVKPNTIKRPIEHEGERETPGSTKKRRVRNAGTESLSPRNEKPPQKEPDDTRRLRSTSPEDFSVFDNSTIENSQVTAISEPDLEITAAPAVAENRPRQRGMTREEARQKAEIIRLRLGLAGYKVKTNQTDVPLERLQARPVPGKLPKQMPSVLLPTLQATSAQCLAALSQREERERLSSPARIKRTSVGTVLSPARSPRRNESNSPVSPENNSPTRQSLEPALPPEVLSTPQRRLSEKGDDRLSDTEHGGAAEGLLSLSQSSPASTLK